MNTDFRLCTGLFTHPKFLKLERKMGSEGALALIKLFCFAAQNRPDGSLRNMDAESIAMAAGYDGDASEFVAALVSIRWIDGKEGDYQIHDWAEHNPWAAGALGRSEQARRAADARWNKPGNSHTGGMPSANGQHAVSTGEHSNDSDLCGQHARSMRSASISNAPSPSPSPSPSPNPSSGACARPEAFGEEPGAAFDAEIERMEAESRHIEDEARAESRRERKAVTASHTHGESEALRQSRTSPPIPARPPSSLEGQPSSAEREAVEALRQKRAAILAEFPFAKEYLEEQCDRAGKRGEIARLTYQRGIWSNPVRIAEWREQKTLQSRDEARRAATDAKSMEKAAARIARAKSLGLTLAEMDEKDRQEGMERARQEFAALRAMWATQETNSAPAPVAASVPN